jgi:phosphoribosylamine--glycine ligase
MPKAAIIGKDGRTSALEKSLSMSHQVVYLSHWKNEPVAEAKQTVLRRAAEERPDFVVIGPEEPLAEGVVDLLQEKLGIPCVGPTKALAELESSKSFTRDLLSEYNIAGNPEYDVFHGLDGIEPYLKKLGEFVVKPDGLTGGKGVKISNAHLFSIEESLDYCRELFYEGHRAVVIEEKLEGEEFSLMSFCDGDHVVNMVPVQDHKRVGEGDTGPNTGGMGSYSCADHSLPFLSSEHIQEASNINKLVAGALFAKTGQKYKGILYGGFMVTSNGLRLLEYNARFGDPETLNVLPILKTDFGDICKAIIKGNLDDLPIVFDHRGTVCKYVVPEGYPEDPIKNVRIDLSNVPSESDNLKIYYAAVDKRPDGVYLTGSRAIAFVGIGDNLDEAEAIAERAASAVRGPVIHRRDIGTRELIQHRIDHVKELRARVKPEQAWGRGF